jgi:hypothetical protein
MVMAVPVATAPAGTVTVTAPKPVALPPAAVTNPPGATVTVADADFVSLVAVIVAEPAATPATTPLLSTVAVAAALVDHVIVRPVNVLPAASLSVAERFNVWFGTIVPVDWFNVTVETGTGPTVMVALAEYPPLEAVIVVVPCAKAVTVPPVLTVATVGTLEVQVNV